MQGHKAKRKGFGLEMKTFTGKQTGTDYLVFRLPNGSYHVFVETEAKAAARDCGGNGTQTRTYWDPLWKKSSARASD